MTGSVLIVDRDSGNAKKKKSKSGNSVSTLQIPSNVTRISRAFARTCADGTFQIIYYQSGVGSGLGLFNRLAGGAFGVGVAENIREAYAYICANYVDGDEIILIGFSRGAFTARSIAGMISDLGLLTRDGMQYFFPVFKDMQHWMDYKYDDPFPEIPFPFKPKGSNASATYRQRLVEENFTRVRQNGGIGDPICVKAIGVWDTVGSLGIPEIPFLTPLGINRSTHEFTWYNTALNPKIEHAFQALALDDTRRPFSPAIWERVPGQITDLRQVWFPGDHSNIGGGQQDQGMANIVLAWMMDQLSSIGIEFVLDTLDKLFQQNVEHYKSLGPYRRQIFRPCCTCGPFKPSPRHWALKAIHKSNDPLRPWGLHRIEAAKSCAYDLIGEKVRSPGMYKKINPTTGMSTSAFLEETNERIHSSGCSSLTKLWHPRQIPADFFDPVSKDASWGPQADSNGVSVQPNHTETGSSTAAPQLRWIWEYIGPQHGAPPMKVIVEETMGPFEKHLLKIACGKDERVLEQAEREDFKKFKFPSQKRQDK